MFFAYIFPLQLLIKIHFAAMFFIKKNLKHLECIWVSVEAGRSFCATPMGATCHLPLPGLWGVHRARSSLLQGCLPCCSCSRTSLGGTLRNAALSTHSSPQAKGVKDHGVAPPPCAQPSPCPARLGSPGPWRAVTRVALEARADQEPESLNIFHFLPESQPRRGQGLADSASGAVLPQQGQWGGLRR